MRVTSYFLLLNTSTYSHYRPLLNTYTTALTSSQIHKPEPHILLFRRSLGTDPTTGKVDPALKKAALEKYQRDYGM